MKLQVFIGLHRRINNLTFLMLYEATLLSKWLQTFDRQWGSDFEKDKRRRRFCPLNVYPLLFFKN